MDEGIRVDEFLDAVAMAAEVYTFVQWTEHDGQYVQVSKRRVRVIVEDYGAPTTWDFDGLDLYIN